jgi:prevent-host-death family protein
MSEETITAAEANRNFSRLLRGVREGQSYVVTAHGRPVAKLVPADQDAATTARKAAFDALMKRLDSQPATNTPRSWTRDELYER